LKHRRYLDAFVVVSEVPIPVEEADPRGVLRSHITRGKKEGMRRRKEEEGIIDSVSAYECSRTQPLKIT
jgi:hypothetical protein